MQMRLQKGCTTFQTRGKWTSRKIGEFTVTDRLSNLASRGDAPAQYRLACCYADGFSVEQDEPTACIWFQHSADQGYVPAMFRLGEALLNGDGIVPNRVRGLRWLLKAANRNNRDAAALLGTSYLKGQGLPKRTDLAVKWLRIAANRGCIFSILNLGYCYKDGIGIEQDIVKACVCLNVLEARSKKGVTSRLNMEWSDEMTKEQLAESMRMSHRMIHGGRLDL